MRTLYHTRRQPKKQRAQIDEAAIVNETTLNKDTTVNAVTIPPPIPNPYTQKVNLHIHHWQIFYVLAFFTRYVIKSVCA